jgi:hypothetical protein
MPSVPVPSFGAPAAGAGITMPSVPVPSFGVPAAGAGITMPSVPVPSFALPVAPAPTAFRSPVVPLVPVPMFDQLDHAALAAAAEARRERSDRDRPLYSRTRPAREAAAVAAAAPAIALNLPFAPAGPRFGGTTTTDLRGDDSDDSDDSDSGRPEVSVAEARHAGDLFQRAFAAQAVQLVRPPQMQLIEWAFLGRAHSIAHLWHCISRHASARRSRGHRGAVPLIQPRRGQCPAVRGTLQAPCALRGHRRKPGDHACTVYAIGRHARTASHKKMQWTWAPSWTWCQTAITRRCTTQRAWVRASVADVF